MADRRRTISTNPSHPHGTVPSSIPRPNTTLRQSLAPGASSSLSHSRQSLAPGAGAGRARASIAPGAHANQHGFGESQSSSQGSSQGVFSQGHGGPPQRPEPPMTVGRTGAYSSFGASMSVGRPAGGLRSSMAPGGMGMSQVEYAPPSERRTSTYRRSTMMGPGGPNALLTATPGGGIGTSTTARPAKDPRAEISRSRGVRTKWAQDIVAFCVENHFTTDEKQLMQPTGTQFQAIFKFLINLFDSSIHFGQGGTGKKFEDEVLATLRMVQYPFTDSISKSHLQAIGSAQSWPNMLAMLHWLVTTIKNRHAAFASYPELHIPAMDYAERAHSEDVTAQAWLHYVGQAYAKFLTQGDEGDFGEEEEEFRKTVDGSRQAQRARLDELRNERDELEQQWKELTARPDPIHAYQKHVAAVKSDTQKCNDYIAGLTKKMESYRLAKVQAEQDNERMRQDRDSKRLESQRLEHAVKSQKLTPLELQSLSSDKQNLTKQMVDVQGRYRTVLSKTMNLEVDLNNRITSAAALCAEYDEKAQKLGLLDGPIQGYEEVPFAQEINSASENPVPEGLSTVVKPALQRLRARTRDELKEVNREGVDVEEKVTKVREEIGELVDQEKGAEEELRLVDGDKEKLQDAIDREAATSDAELVRLQTQVNAISSTMGEALSAAEHRYQQRVAERVDALSETTALRNANRAALEQAIEQIMTYKEHMQEKTDRLGGLLDEAEEAGIVV
ncbi:hypothetical protein JCM8547_008211 [Rhodosporidiobolus lusitaniae]